MEHDVDPSDERGAVISDADRARDRFILTSRSRDEGMSFTDAREAGAAFFAADPAERPSVVHAWNNAARTMARTEIHGAYETGEMRYSKSLPDSHAPDAAFRSGFLEAMETSLNERLDKIEHRSEAGIEAGQLDARLKDDLETFARREPEKAAALWTEHSDTPPPGPELRAAVESHQETADRDLASYYDTLEEKPPVIATGDWVTTDINVELRPVAVASDRGVHTGYEAVLPDGGNEVTYSDRTFGSTREAIKHAWDFYQGGEEGLEIAVKSATELGRDQSVEVHRGPEGSAPEPRAQPEFARPETAIYAGEDAQLVLTLGGENDRTRELAAKLIADPGFQKVVDVHIPGAKETLGPGRFEHGSSSISLPDELVAVTAPDRDGDRTVLAKLPNQNDLSLALAEHLVASPIVAQHVQSEQERSSPWDNPAKAISTWLEEINERIDHLPATARQDLRAQMYGIAAEASSAFGLDAERKSMEASPRSALYSTAISAEPVQEIAGQVPLSTARRGLLRTSLRDAAAEAGLDANAVGQRLETGAANAHQEEAWVKSDLAEVAARHSLDLGDPRSAGRAAEIVDRFYEKAAELLHNGRVLEGARNSEPLIEALHTMAKVHGSQGAVAFRSEDQARDFAEEMKERYGQTVLHDIAAGRTEALAKDVPDPAARQAMAQAVIAAAKEHPSLGLSAHEAEAAERSLSAQARGRDRSAEHARDRDRDREF